MLKSPLAHLLAYNINFGTSSVVLVPGEGIVAVAGQPSRQMVLAADVAAPLIADMGLCFKATIKIDALPESSFQAFELSFVDSSTMDEGWRVRVEISTDSGNLVYQMFVGDYDTVLVSSAKIALPNDGYLGIAGHMTTAGVVVSINGGAAVTAVPLQTVFTPDAVGFRLENQIGASTDSPTIGLREIIIYPKTQFAANQVSAQAVANPVSSPVDPFDPSVSDAPFVPVSANFMTGSYTVGGSSAALNSIFSTSPTVTGGQGIVNTGDASTNLLFTNTEAYIDGFVMVADVYINLDATNFASASFGLGFTDQPNQIEMWSLSLDATRYGSFALSCYVTDNLDAYAEQDLGPTMPADNLFKIAMRVTASGELAMSVNGGTPISAQSFSMFYRNSVGIGLITSRPTSSVRLRTLEMLPLEDYEIADLAALSAI